MKRKHPPRLILAITFLIMLFAIASGPIGLLVIVMIGVPLAIFIALDVMAHSGSSGTR
jgi:hypothetical protein